MNLWNYLDNQRELKRITDLIEVLDSKLQGLGVDYSRIKVKSTPVNDRIGELVDKLNSLKAEQEQAQETAIREMAKVVEAIQSVEDPKQREILQRRYIEGQTWDTIAQEMGYTWRWLIKLHGQALAEIGGKDDN